MYQSANDIVCIPTNRETILIGTPGSFGVIHQDVLARGRGEINSIVAQMFAQPGIAETLRPHLRTWGLESSNLRNMTNAVLRNWIGGRAVQGSLALAIIADPMVAFVSHIQRQENTMAKAVSFKEDKAAKDDDEDEEEEELLPPDIETRFLITFDMVPQHLGLEARKKVDELIEIEGIETFAAGILIWIGSQFVPGLHLVVAAANMPSTSGLVLRALESVSNCILDLEKITKRSEAERIAEVMAGSIGILAINGVLSRILVAGQITRGPSGSTQGGLRKRR